MGYTNCTARGCQAVFELDDARLRALKKGRRLQVTVAGMDGGTLNIPMSLSGFTAAWNSLR